MSYLFCKCNSLEKLPDISKWDVKNVTNMNGIFAECYSLKSIPDISKWFNNVKKVENPKYIGSIRYGENHY